MGAANAESINGVDVFLVTYETGNGEAEWTLADGSMGYLGSRGLDREQLVAILTQLTPRPADSPIPRFDYGAGGPDGLALVAEQLNTAPRDATFVGSQCRVESTGYVYQIGATTGNAVFTYATVIDRPPPVDVAVVGNAVIVINGIDDLTAPRASDVLDADEEPWRQLLIAQEPVSELAQLIGGDSEVVVDFVPIVATSTPVSSLTLRIDVQDGVAFLEVYLSDVIIVDASEYWKTEINGRMRGRSSARPGEGQGVFGSRLGDSPSFEKTPRSSRCGSRPPTATTRPSRPRAPSGWSPRHEACWPAVRMTGTVEFNPEEAHMSWIRRKIGRLKNLASGADYAGDHQGGSGTTSEQHNRASFEAQSYRPDRTGGDFGGGGGSI